MAAPIKRARADDTSESSDSFRIANNFIGGKWVPPSAGNYIDVISPQDGAVIGKVAVSDAKDVAQAVEVANAAQEEWGSWTVKKRVQCLIRFHQLLIKHTEELIDLIVLEHGKNRVEAKGSINKGNETVEYAISMPQLIAGRYLEVSRGVNCRDERRPLGVVASIVPFNFPIMVPMWTIPIALAAGNTVILKPSEKVPLTMARVAELMQEAGVPDGVFNIINGMVDSVNALIDSPDVKAVSFVGSTKIAEIVAKRARNLNKRVLALGGAKNHLVSAPDCNTEMASTDIVNSFCGCTGQRCMAATVLLTIGEQKELMDKIVAKAKAMQPGDQAREVGPVIDQAAVDRIHAYIQKSIDSGAEILVDGRSWTTERKNGFWVGPTVILHKNKEDAAMQDEIFGPLISVYQVSSKEEAIEIENANEYGNAAAVYTSSGGTADWFTSRFSAGMLGVNIGVPVPREPFSFGGINASKFGDFDITGDGGMEFFTKRIKVTTKWNPPQEANWMS
jgi:malonate-semialdehyde dehydrogenase (acetylating) / methylmalonate-semialdehyde dehydrogenase